MEISEVNECMDIRYTDMRVETSIDFGSENDDEKEVLRELYLLLVNMPADERIGLLEKIVKGGDVDD